jgi:ribokinase
MADPASVLVIGSVNHDITVRVVRFPRPGETLIGLDVAYGLGGKGANQAVAAARAGARTSLLATVGDDDVGAELVGRLRERGVDTSLVGTAPGLSTGTAHIVVDASGENQIVVVSGANHATLRVNREAVAAAGIVVLGGELPAATIEQAVTVAREVGTSVLLNLAPVLALTPEALAAVEYLVVNETEAGALLGRSLSGSLDNALAAVAALTAISTTAVITLGAQGAVWGDATGRTGHLAAPVVSAVDTTGAGDAFVGVMAAALAGGHGLPPAVALAVQAASLTVRLPGAAMSYPPIDLP